MEIVRSDQCAAQRGRVQEEAVSPHHHSHWLQQDAPRLSRFLDPHMQLELTEVCDGAKEGTFTCECRPVVRFNGKLQAVWRDVGMACTRRTKTLVSTCVILSGMTNIVCLLYVGWVTNYIANIYIKVPMPLPERKLEGDKKGDTLRIMERLDRLENVVNQHIQ
eukprot:superscaffoldBa00000206_g2708